jgi:hypothetical protein
MGGNATQARGAPESTSHPLTDSRGKVLIAPRPGRSGQQRCVRTPHGFDLSQIRPGDQLAFPTR